MKLYYKPGACSLGSRNVLTELGETLDAIRVDTDTGLTETGADYRAINVNGYVPALEVADGSVITENPAILRHPGDSAAGAREDAGARLICARPAAGMAERYLVRIA
jgi:glutathione S-transferase